VALVAGEQHDGAVARLLAQPLDAVFVDDDAVVDAVPDPVEEASQLGDHVGLLVGAQLAELFARFLLHLGDAAARAARLVLDVLANARAAQEVVLDAAERLLGGPEDQRALALHAPQQGVAHLVGELRVGELGVLGQERLEIERLPRAQQRVPVVEEELQQHAHAPRPLHRPEDTVHQPAPRLGRALGPHEGLRHQEDRLLGVRWSSMSVRMRSCPRALARRTASAQPSSTAMCEKKRS
jgi:hypothetical protein